MRQLYGTFRTSFSVVAVAISANWQRVKTNPRNPETCVKWRYSLKHQINETFGPEQGAETIFKIYLFVLHLPFIC